MKKVNMMLVCAVALAMAGFGAPPPAKNAVPPHPAPHSGMVPRPLPPVPPKKGLLPKGALRVRPFRLPATAWSIRLRSKKA